MSGHSHSSARADGCTHGALRVSPPFGGDRRAGGKKLRTKKKRRARQLWTARAPTYEGPTAAIQSAVSPNLRVTRNPARHATFVAFFYSVGTYRTQKLRIPRSDRRQIGAQRIGSSSPWEILWSTGDAVRSGSQARGPCAHVCAWCCSAPEGLLAEASAPSKFRDTQNRRRRTWSCKGDVGRHVATLDQL